MTDPGAAADAALEAAIQAHRAGRLDEARAQYEAVLAAAPGHWRASHNLGVLLLNLKDREAALPLLAEAVSNEPAGGRSWVTYVQALVAADRFGEAEQALATHGGAGDPQAAALEVRLRQGWGMALAASADLAGAEAQFRRVLQLAADDADAHADLGYILMRRDEPAAAETSLRRALALSPGHLQATLNLGSALRALGRTDEAESHYRRALGLQPGNPAAIRNLAILFGGLGRHKDMLDLVEGLDLEAPSALASMIRGAAFGALRRFDEGLAALEQAVTLAPDDTMARFRRGELRLLLGRFEGGWEDYDARWGNETFLNDSAGAIQPELLARLTVPVTRADVVGRRVLLVGEQGLGDQVMFASMIPDLLADAARVTCLCERKLVRLFAHAFPQVDVRWRGEGVPDAGGFDVTVPMGGLGRIYRNDAGAFPGAPFLRPRDEIRNRWAARLGPRPSGLRIGVSWRGGTRNTRTGQRSMPLEQLMPVLSLPACEFVSLQYGDVAAELAAVNAGLENKIRAFPADDVSDYEDVAGLIQNLDVVVSVQTAVVHLSGAIGADCLTLIPYQAEWRYTAHSATMPWYRSVQLFRQSQPGDWAPTVAQVTEVLQGKLRERGVA